jgi:hypothetical protein
MIEHAMARRRGRSDLVAFAELAKLAEIATCGFVVLAGCASAPALESAPAPAPAATPAEKQTPSKTSTLLAAGDASAVDGAEGLVALCESLRDEATMNFPGNPVEQARALEAHAQRRQAALAGRYVTVVPAAGYDFRSYDLSERRLLLDTDRTLALDDGAEMFIADRDSAPGFALSPESAERVSQQRAAGKLGLRLIFRPAQSELRKNACAWLGGGRVVKLGIEIVASALVAPGGIVLARGDTGDYADASPGTPVRAPKVQISKPRSADGKDLPRAMSTPFAALAVKAKPCYDQALHTRPALRGTLVLAVRLGSGGRVEAAHVEMSTLGDDALSSCVAAKAATATIQGASAGQHFSVPLRFGSAEEF